MPSDEEVRRNFFSRLSPSEFFIDEDGDGRVDESAIKRAKGMGLLARGSRERALFDAGQLLPVKEERREEHRSESRGGGGGGSGSGSKSGGVSGPTVPTVKESTEDITEAYLGNLDKVAKGELDAYSKYAPEYAKKQQQIINDLYPEQSGLGELIAGEVSRRLSVEDYAIPEPLKRQYQELRRGADAERGMLRSGMSGRAEAEDLATLGMQMRQNDINTGLALHGGLPKVAPMQGIPGQGTTGQFTGLGFQGNQAGMNRSLQSALANQRTGLGYYQANLSAALAREGHEIQRQGLANQYSLGLQRLAGQDGGNYWQNLGGTALALGAGDFISEGLGSLTGSIFG